MCNRNDASGSCDEDHGEPISSRSTVLEILAHQIVNPTLPGSDVRLTRKGKVVASGEDSPCNEIEWRGSVSEWQAALLAALSAKRVEQDPVVECNGKFYFHDETWSDVCGPYDTREAACGACSEYAKSLEDGIVRKLGGTWGHRLDDPTYPRLTSWVRSRPRGSCLLAVYADGENRPAIAQGDSDGKFLVFVKESEIDEVIPIERYYCFNFVWLSKEVGPGCIGKIPRGVKVYRER